jgi:hypothetical protein
MPLTKIDTLQMDGFNQHGDMIELQKHLRFNISPIILLPAGDSIIDASTGLFFRKTGGNTPPRSNVTITLRNLVEGQTINILMVSTGTYAINWTGYTIRWPQATIPVPTATANRIDIFSFLMLGGEVFGNVSLNYG